MDNPGLNTKRVGLLGEYAVHKHIIENYGFGIYTPVVDDSGIDMVVDTGTHLKRVQVKTRNKARRGTTSIEINCKKYMESNIDVFAIYYRPSDIVAYYPYNGEEMLVLAVSTAKNNQESKRNWFYKYMEFPL
tara:strand:- start:1619 stop:2014 length:396 start_codon:yes stop_codon:yes gene_type:complete